MHAIGLVKSIAIPIFLAAPNRYASQNARFYFHTYNWSTGAPETAALTTLEERTLLLGDAIAWSKSIIKATTKLTDSDFEAMQLFKHPHIMPPARAVGCDIISAIIEPRMPIDAPAVIVG
jgi:ATP-dependent protease ClpP protease subunit